jgi:hypothetical protein
VRAATGTDVVVEAAHDRAGRTTTSIPLT